MATVTCISCHQSFAVDETKLPLREVAFPCPSCKSRITFDRRTLAPAEPLAAAATEQGVPDQDDTEYREAALIAGLADPEVARAARALGFRPHQVDSADACREIYLRDYPPIVFLRPSQLSPPPLAEIAPMTLLNPVDRRRGFFILVAENLRTLDGNAAFLYGVNLVVATKDLGSIVSIYREAHSYHERLYQSMTAVAGGT
ncbi:MAG TPA: hypothetical protein VMT00_01790 [Thermoanaerobaculia bacterium]|nr:hypothetical protein [Thermoanaerobaculia bacterium]